MKVAAAPVQAQVISRLALVTTRPAAMVSPLANLQVPLLMVGAVTQIMPSGSVSTTFTAVALDGPLFVAFRVYSIFWPASALPGAACFSAVMLVSAVRVTSAESLLLPLSYSAVSGELTKAVFVILFVWLALLVGSTYWRALIVTVYSSLPTGTSCKVHFTSSASALSATLL